MRIDHSNSPATVGRRALTLAALALLAALLGVAALGAPAQAAKKKGGKGAAVTLKSSKGKSAASGQALRLKGTVKKWSKGQRVLLLAKAAGVKKWSRAGATKLRANKRFSFKVKPPLGKTGYRAVAQRHGKRAPKAASKPLRVLGLPAATRTLSVGAGGSVSIGGLLPTAVKRKVVLQERQGGKWKAAGSKRSTGKGQISFRVTVSADTSFRLFAPAHRLKSKKSKNGKGKKGKGRKRTLASTSKKKKGKKGKRGKLPPFTSPPVNVRVGSRQVGLTMPADLCTGQQVDATVSVAPAAAGGAVEIQVSADGGATWTAAGSAIQGADGAAAARFIGPESSGSYLFRAVSAGSSSPPTAVEVRLCAAYPPLPQIYGGGGHSCEIDAFGETWCWGENRFGQLGDGTYEEHLKPVKVAGGHSFVDLALGELHTCGIVESGNAYCWGSNGSAPTEGSWNPFDLHQGALGDGTETNRGVPTPVSGGHRFVQLTAGQEHTCGLTTTGVAYCWGLNRHGEIGDGSFDGSFGKRIVPTRVLGGGFEEIDAFGWSTCGLSGGRVFCWGDPGHTPQPEDGVPSAIGGSYPLLHDIETGYARDGCALSATGTVYCWGGNANGRLGRGPGADPNPEPGPVTGDHKFTDVAGGNKFVCGLTDENSVLCWGYNNFGALGRGFAGGYFDAYPTPEPVVGGHAFTRLGLGYGHSCAIDSGGFAWCWGHNGQGQLGIGVKGVLEPAVLPNTVLFPNVS